MAMGLVLTSASMVSAQTDYSLGQGAWNGLDGLLEIAASEGIDVRTPERLDVDSLRPEDALLLIYPTRPPPGSSIGAFLRRGGRVALADDFGSGGALLARYHVTRTTPAPGSPELRGRPELSIARADGTHPLSRGVSALVTNHPMALHHASLPPIFHLGRADDALVLTGAVGEGRFVALSDPSVLINNMLEFRGNRRFAANLLRYLSAGRGGRVYLVTARTELLGASSSNHTRARSLGEWREAFDRADLPPAAMRVLSLLFVALLLLAALTSLPRRSPYRVDELLPRALPGGGYAGHIAFFREQGRNLLYPAITYKLELERALVEALTLSPHPLLRDVLAALRRTSMPEAQILRLRALLLELDELVRREDLPPGPPKVSRRTLSRMVQTGERALEWLATHAEAR
ncbi:MAG: DUF4350 domain-containing protein [Deltaproteobacteria bacterium]|nr:DUF4350 domain-containing protein [Deltaproteobacteria bacterium]